MEDLTWLDVDAIVNPTNESLVDKTGVSGSILAGGGPGLVAECLATETCRTGECVLTQAGNLHAKYACLPPPFPHRLV